MSYEEKHMKCPFLKGKGILSCRSLGAVYVPSISELDTYCRHDGHKKCALYSTSPKDNARVDTIGSGVIKSKAS